MLRRGITDAAAEVKETAARIGESAQWNTVALIAVAVVSILALTVATASLTRRAPR
jgi:hypothetical protein